MTKRPTHPNQAIEEAICYAEKNGWIYHYRKKLLHTWGRMLCPLRARERHQMSIWVAPKNINIHVRQIHKLVDKCKHAA